MVRAGPGHQRGHEMIAEGADMVDVGGESTRPGAEPVAVDEELRRVIPVIEALAGQVRVSVDTTKEAVAEAAVEAGATLINDVSASLWAVAARRRVGWVAMHRVGTAATMQRDPRYDDVVTEVTAMLVERAGPGPGRRGGRGVDRSRHRLREDGRPQSRAARRAGPAGGHRVSRSWSARAGRVSWAWWRPDADGATTPVDRPAAGVVGHGHLGHGPGRGHGPGPRCGGHRPGRRAGGSPRCRCPPESGTMSARHAEVAT